jgi:hypothetical protein
MDADRWTRLKGSGKGPNPVLLQMCYINRENLGKWFIFRDLHSLSVLHRFEFSENQL